MDMDLAFHLVVILAAEYARERGLEYSKVIHTLGAVYRSIVDGVSYSSSHEQLREMGIDEQQFIRALSYAIQKAIRPVTA